MTIQKTCRYHHDPRSLATLLVVFLLLGLIEQNAIVPLFTTTTITTVTAFMAAPPLMGRRRQQPTTTTSRGMFTGIVEEMGQVVSFQERDDMTLWDGTKGSGTELVVQSNDGVVMDAAYLGCSICVSGVCLTATDLDFEKKQFTVGLAPETLRRTYFPSLQAGDAVNLERASEIGGRNSGHFVQGHVDGTGTILERVADEDSLSYKVTVDDKDLLKYIVPKGFIAIDGTSLTVVDVNTEEGWFSFMLIEYTQKKIIVSAKLPGDKVNLEVDVLGKYSETALAALVPRLEALESKVAFLESKLAAIESSATE